MKKIICLGNRFISPDNFGMRIYEELKNKNIDDIEVIEGGIGGLNLALHFECEDSILLVDYGIGYDKNLLSMKEVCDQEIDGYSHDSALLYLLKSLDKENIQMFVPTDSSWNESDISNYSEKIENIARLM